MRVHWAPAAPVVIRTFSDRVEVPLGVRQGSEAHGFLFREFVGSSWSQGGAAGHRLCRRPSVEPLAGLALSTGGGADLVAFERGAQLAESLGGGCRRGLVEGPFDQLAQARGESGLGGIEEL